MYVDKLNLERLSSDNNKLPSSIFNIITEIKILHMIIN